MGFTSFTQELTSTLPAAKVFKANVVDGHILVPKLMPESVASASVVGGGGIGSIRETKFTQAMPYPYMKERLDVFDSDNMECKTTLLEGADIGTKLESATCHVKVESTADGGSLYKVTCEYQTLGDNYSEQDKEWAKNAIIGMFKAIDAYLIATPDYA